MNTTIVSSTHPTERNNSTTITSAAAGTTSTSVTTALPQTTTEFTTSPLMTTILHVAIAPLLPKKLIIIEDGDDDTGTSCDATCSCFSCYSHIFSVHSSIACYNYYVVYAVVA